MTTTSEILENKIFVRSYYTLCYLMPTLLTQAHGHTHAQGTHCDMGYRYQLLTILNIRHFVMLILSSKLSFIQARIYEQSIIRPSEVRSSTLIRPEFHCGLSIIN